MSQDGGGPPATGVTGTPFDELARYVGIPRVTALRLAPDGTWLAAVVQTLSEDGKKYVSSIWRLSAQPETSETPRRLTRSADGEKNPRFRPDGALLYISKRPGQQAGADDGKAADQAALWLLPAGGGEAVRVTARPGGVSAVETATGSDTVVLSAPVLPGGGARGAYEAGALSVLLPLLEQRGEDPVILCGTSVGAINAAW